MSDERCDMYCIERNLGLSLTTITENGINLIKVLPCIQSLNCTETLVSYPAKGFEVTAGGIRDIARSKELDQPVHTCIILLCNVFNVQI